MTNEQRGLLRELQADPRWSGILEGLKREPPTPYKPGSEDPFNDWIFESGRYRENQKLLKLLTGDSNV